MDTQMLMQAACAVVRRLVVEEGGLTRLEVVAEQHSNVERARVELTYAEADTTDRQAVEALLELRMRDQLEALAENASDKHKRVMVHVKPGLPFLEEPVWFQVWLA